MKEQLYKIFGTLGITTREDLRREINEIKLEGTNQQLIEGYFSEYKKEINGGRRESPRQATRKVISISDIHFPYQNKKMLRAWLELLDDEQPDVIVLNGDILDFYDLSSFDKNPLRVNRLQEEIDECVKFLTAIRRVCKTAEIYFIEGNHEDRLRRFLWKNPSISSLKALTLESLLKLDQLKIRLVEHYTINGFKYKHGGVVRSHSSYSAKAEFEKELSSGESGHTHRVGSYCKTTEKGTFGWWESGCACDLRPEYIKGTPDWQNSFTVRYFDGKAFDTHQVYVHEGEFRFNGKRY